MANSDPIHGSLLRQSVFAVHNGSVVVEWPEPLDPDEVPLILEWIDLAKRQIARRGSGKPQTRAALTELGASTGSGSEVSEAPSLEIKPSVP